MSLFSCHQGPKPEINTPVRIRNNRGRLYLYLHYCYYWYHQIDTTNWLIATSVCMCGIYIYIYIYIYICVCVCVCVWVCVYNGGIRDVMVTVVENGHCDPSSNTRWGCFHFHITLIPSGKVWIQLFSLQIWVSSRTDCAFSPWYML